MPSHTLKIVASVIALLSFSGGALAQNAHLTAAEGAFPFDAYYNHLDLQHAQFTEVVLASAQTRMRERFAAIDHPPRYSALNGRFAGIQIAP